MKQITEKICPVLKDIKKEFDERKMAGWGGTISRICYLGQHLGFFIYIFFNLLTFLLC